MAVGVVLKETMSGWLRLDEDGRDRDFSFSLQSFTPEIFRMSAPRAFRGVARLEGRELPCRGELVILASGPRYSVRFEHPELGALHAEGKKEYGKGGWLRSLVTCPLVVYRGGERVGEAEVAYRDSMLAFPFKALRLVREEKAFGEYGEHGEYGLGA